MGHRVIDPVRSIIGDHRRSGPVRSDQPMIADQPISRSADQPAVMVGGRRVMPGKKSRRRRPDPGPPFFYLSIYIAPHEIFWPFWLKNKVLTSDNKAVRNSGMTLNYL